MRAKLTSMSYSATAGISGVLVSRYKLEVHIGNRAFERNCEINSPMLYGKPPVPERYIRENLINQVLQEIRTEINNELGA